MPDLAAIRDAAALLRGVVHRTPLHPSATFSRLVGAAVYLKCENLQRSGSFKVRGAYVRIQRLSAAERGKGVVAASAGNHAQGVALAAAAAGLTATILMPRHAPMAKVMATESYGARVLLQGENYDEAAERAKALAAETGAAALAALLHGRVKPEPAPAVAILSGGNIDINFLTRILSKGLAKAGRYLQLEVPVVDRPGALKALLAVVAEEQANVVSVSHDRLDPRVPVDRVEVYLTLETRDAAHARRLLQALRHQGYAVRRRAGPVEE